ncbi:MAG: bacillithiol biosynthesis cysteine-adding enzyme BshC [Chitinophagaceae bacterium]
MDCNVTAIPYGEIGYFSKIIVDYLQESPSIRPFYEHPLTVQGVSEAIASRKLFNTNRKLLVDVLQSQYTTQVTSDKVRRNIEALAEENTFTIVTAHQPNIFTGHLYFIYKILHIIKLCTHLNKELPEHKFVPVFYMGSEDADLEELGHIFLGNEKIVWETNQKGAVGRMNTKGLDKIVERVAGELSVHPFGNELIALLKACYLNAPDIQTATFRFADELFKEYGLIILLPDNPVLKRSMLSLFEDDLLNQLPSSIVEETNKRLSQHYKVQANPREINLFYLKDDLRERIVKKGNEWKVVGQEIRFTEASLKEELRNHPERFSPNVILRGLFQETILPNIAFIGGGGETAYWLELKDLFKHYGVPYPLLVLRNSFLFIDKNVQLTIDKLGFPVHALFREERLLLEELVKRQSTRQLELNNEIEIANALYDDIQRVAYNIDKSLLKHVEALKVRATRQLHILEKKMLKAEKRKYDDQQRQIQAVKAHLFPNRSLQERIENFMPYYARYGPDFIETIYRYSPALDQDFIILNQHQ